MAHHSKKTLAKKSLDAGMILAWNTALDFILAGRCIVTLESVATGERNTYLVEQVVNEVQVGDKVVEERQQRWWVSLLVGSDNTLNYAYLGTVDKVSGKLAFRTTKATAKNKGASADNINRFGDVIRDLVAGTDNAHCTRIWHRGLCGHCCKPLTVPSSIATGIGPVCAKKLGIKMVDTTPTAIEKLAALAPESPNTANLVA